MMAGKHTENWKKRETEKSAEREEIDLFCWQTGENVQNRQQIEIKLCWHKKTLM